MIHFLKYSKDNKLSIFDKNNNIKLNVDFLTGKISHRIKYGGGKNQLLAKAIGIKGKFRPNVLDATAGLGVDGFLLATLGCHVTMIEQNKMIYQLLLDGLLRAQQDNKFKDLNINLINNNSILYLEQSKKKFDVIYLDPMFPDRKKSALVKKEMRILKEIVGNEQTNSIQLLKTAIAHAVKRVVVKRPKLAPEIYNNTIKPTLSLKGKSSRFDIYIL